MQASLRAPKLSSAPRTAAPHAPKLQQHPVRQAACVRVHSSSDRQAERMSTTLGACALSLLLATAPAQATGLESVDLLPKLQSMQPSQEFKEGARKEAEKLQSVDDGFQNSETLKRLLEQSAANKAKNQKAVSDKYCYRQAEIGVGDCGGLRYIPGMTESGKQRTPDWLAKLLGVEPQPAQEGGLTLKDLFGEDFKKP